MEPRYDAHYEAGASPDPLPSLDTLKIGLLIDTFEQPAWVIRMIDELLAAPHIHISLIVRNGSPAPAPLSFWHKLYHHRSIFLFAFYQKLDKRIFGAPPDPFQEEDLQPLVMSTPTLEVTPIEKGFSDFFLPEDVERIRSYDLDVAVRLGFRILRGEALKIARHGVWSYHHGDNRRYRGAPAGFWEIAERTPVTGSILQILSEELDGGRVLYRSYAATDFVSWNLNKKNFFWKTSTFLLRSLTDLWREGKVKLEEETFPYSLYGYPLYRTPGNGAMAKIALKILGRWLKREIVERFCHEQWFLAYRIKRREGDANSAIYRFQALLPPRDRIWADPFPVWEEGRYFIFIEEMTFKENKGRIAVLTLHPDGTWEAPRTVLERNCHLSYPYIFRWRDRYFMIPETKGNRTIELYACASFPDRWEYHSTLMSDVVATDATVFEKDGRWWMFVAMAVEGAKCEDELFLFHADTPLGPWTPHPRNPVQSDVRKARPAGRVFEQNGKYFRPAQDCSVRYGFALSLHEIRVLDPERYEEVEVGRLEPEWAPGLLATHTFNVAGDLTIVDAYRRISRWGPGTPSVKGMKFSKPPSSL